MKVLAKHIINENKPCHIAHKIYLQILIRETQTKQKKTYFRNELPR